MPSTTPGWYPDPDPNASPGGQRWHDGNAWTAHVSAHAAPTEQFSPVYSAPNAVASSPAYGQPVYGTPPPAQRSAMPYAPAVPLDADRPGDGMAGGRIVVGSMSKEQFKALPRRERVAKNRPDIDLARGRNSLAFNGVIAAAISFVISGYLVVAIAGIVWSARGLRRANAFEAQGYPPLGRGQATTGLVLGIVSAALGALSLVVRFSSL